MIVLLKINKDGVVSLAEDGKDHQVMASAKTAAEKLALENDDTIVVVESQAMFARRYVVGQIDTRSPPAVTRTPSRDQG
jgi:hypothetical protein